MENVAVSHRVVVLSESICLILDTEHCEVLCSIVADAALSIGADADDAALADGEHLTVNLIFAFAPEDEVKLFVGFVAVEETAVLTGNEGLE